MCVSVYVCVCVCLYVCLCVCVVLVLVVCFMFACVPHLRTPSFVKVDEQRICTLSPLELLVL